MPDEYGVQLLGITERRGEEKKQVQLLLSLHREKEEGKEKKKRRRSAAADRLQAEGLVSEGKKRASVLLGQRLRNKRGKKKREGGGS